MPYSCYHSSDFSNRDFNIVQYGSRDCLPNFCVYYKSSPNYILHYVYSGKGTFCVKSPSGAVTEYKMSANKAFIIYPGQEVWYLSDSAEPFSYRWIEFFGSKAVDFLQCARLSVESPIYTDCPPYKCGDILKELTDGGVLSPMRLTGMFWLLADSFARGGSGSNDMFSQLFNAALKYIHANVASQTSVDSVAKAVGVSRGYLSKIFSKFIDQSPKQYITSYHMNEAKSLLSGTSMSVSEVASAVGFENISDFTRTFKKTVGVSPTRFRKDNSQI